MVRQLALGCHYKGGLARSLRIMGKAVSCFMFLGCVWMGGMAEVYDYGAYGPLPSEGGVLWVLWAGNLSERHLVTTIVVRLEIPP